MKYDNMVDLAYKDVVENDEFTINDMFTYEDQVTDAQQSFNANFNKFYRERQKSYKPVIEFEPFECSEALLKNQENKLEESLKDFESADYKKRKEIEELLRKQLFVSTEEVLLAEVAKSLTKSVNTAKAKSLSTRERFQQSLRERSNKIRILEKELLRTSN